MKKHTVENLLYCISVIKGTKMNSSFTFVENKPDPVSKSHKLFVLKHENAEYNGLKVVWMVKPRQRHSVLVHNGGFCNNCTPKRCLHI
jgi:hypothetical protein